MRSSLWFAHAISDKKLPGAVVLVGQGERTLYQKAIGQRSVAPSAEPMTLDTIFDLASLTKVVATTTSVMILVEEGKIALNDRVAAFIPGFERYGKGNITIRHLLTHMSGLRPDVDLADAWTGSDTAIALAVEEVPTSAPGTRFVYSDINFFLLGDIVAPREWRPDRSVFTRQDFCSARHERHGLHAASLVATPNRADRHQPSHAVSSTIRLQTDGRRRRSRGAFQHGCRPGDFLQDDPRRRDVSWRPHSFSVDGDADDLARDAGRGAKRARSRMGHRFVILLESRRAAAHWILRSHGIHRHIALARSGQRHVRGVPLQSCAS